MNKYIFEYKKETYSTISVDLDKLVKLILNKYPELDKWENFLDEFYTNMDYYLYCYSGYNDWGSFNVPYGVTFSLDSKFNNENFIKDLKEAYENLV